MSADTRTAMKKRDWWSKSLAGLLGGLLIALLCSALFNRLAGAALAFPLRSQLAMWMVAPVWLTLLAGVYLFSSGRRAWLSLASAALLLCAVLLVLGAGR